MRAAEFYRLSVPVQELVESIQRLREETGILLDTLGGYQGNFSNRLMCRDQNFSGNCVVDCQS